MPPKTPLRDELNAALWNIIHLERGLALAFVPIQDEDQISELLEAKRHILLALELESA